MVLLFQDRSEATAAWSSRGTAMATSPSIQGKELILDEMGISPTSLVSSINFYQLEGASIRHPQHFPNLLIFIQNLLTLYAN